MKKNVRKRYKKKCHENMFEHDLYEQEKLLGAPAPACIDNTVVQLEIQKQEQQIVNNQNKEDKKKSNESKTQANNRQQTGCIRTNEHMNRGRPSQQGRCKINRMSNNNNDRNQRPQNRKGHNIIKGNPRIIR